VRRSLRWIRRQMLGISVAEASFARRGFRGGNARSRQCLEEVGRAFLRGYHAALDEDRPDWLAPVLGLIEPELRGFAFEGAGMGLYLLDLLTPWKRGRLRALVTGAGADHAYMVHVGAGWALAQLRSRVDRTVAELDPLLGWLVVDGYGFHHGYFGWPEAVERQRVPRRILGYARRVFDQGLGRSLWFVDGAEVARIAATVARFPVARQPDLWSGVGLACAYAGGADREAIEALMASARAFRAHVAQGAAFAAKARQRAGNPTSHTELACRIIWGTSAHEAAAATDASLTDLPAEGALPAYEVWRQRIEHVWVKEPVTT
jgi:hypothetical protein